MKLKEIKLNLMKAWNMDMGSNGNQRRVWAQSRSWLLLFPLLRLLYSIIWSVMQFEYK